MSQGAAAMPADITSMLRAIPMLAPLDMADLEELADVVDRVVVPGGSILMRQGDPGDAMYIVVNGRLAVLVESEGQDRVVHEAGRAEVLGELALLTGAPRTATVAAIRDTELLRLSVAAFTKLLAAHPEAAVHLTQTLARRLTDANVGRRERSVATVALVPFSEGSPDLAGPLAGALRAHGTTRLLDSKEMESALPTASPRGRPGATEPPSPAAWLDDEEHRHRLVIYRADPEPTPWTLACLRHADRILHVAGPNDVPRPGKIQAAMDAIAGPAAAQEELVLIHDRATQQPSGTARWLRLRPISRHHHIVDSDPEHMARLARSVAGREVGLVLGGGGARGFAHIGVIRAMRELGIPIDRVGGASMGATIAALCAAGGSTDEILRLSREGWARMRPHRGFTIPLLGILSPKRASKMLRMMHGERRAEDLWISFFCVSTNLSTSELVVHREGALHRWLLAAISLPGLAPPVVGDGGDLYVDGALLDNLPVEVMRVMGCGPTLAVSVAPQVEMRAGPEFDKTPTPWQIVAGALRRAPRPEFPLLPDVLQQATVVGSRHRWTEAVARADLHLTPPTEDVGFFRMEAVDRLAAAGYEYAAPRLEQWWSDRRRDVEGQG